MQTWHDTTRVSEMLAALLDHTDDLLHRADDIDENMQRRADMFAERWYQTDTGLLIPTPQPKERVKACGYCYEDDACPDDTEPDFGPFPILAYDTLVDIEQISDHRLDYIGGHYPYECVDCHQRFDHPDVMDMAGRQIRRQDAERDANGELPADALVDTEDQAEDHATLTPVQRRTCRTCRRWTHVVLPPHLPAEFRYTDLVWCPDCDGMGGTWDPQGSPCPRCAGEGTVHPGLPRCPYPPARRTPDHYADRIMSLIVYDERHGPLRGHTIDTYADLHAHLDANQYTTDAGIDATTGDLVNEVESLVDRHLKGRAIVRRHLTQIIATMRAIGDIDVPGQLGMLADTRSNLHASLWEATCELAAALIRLEAPTVARDARRIGALVVDSYSRNPDQTRSLADRIHDALDAYETEPPF